MGIISGRREAQPHRLMQTGDSTDYNLPASCFFTLRIMHGRGAEMLPLPPMQITRPVRTPAVQLEEQLPVPHGSSWYSPAAQIIL